jgi:mannan endo-1,4-beta-mannosidase
MNFIKLWLFRISALLIVAFIILIGISIPQGKEFKNFAKAGWRLAKIEANRSLEGLKQFVIPKTGKPEEKTILIETGKDNKTAAKEPTQKIEDQIIQVETVKENQTKIISRPVMDLNVEGVYLGACLPDIPGKMSSLTNFENKIGKPLAIVHWFQDWTPEDKAFKTEMMKNLDEHGTIAMITWEPWERTMNYSAPQPDFALAKIAAGNFDPFIRDWARQVKNFGSPILIRFCHEMDGNWNPWSIGMNNNTPKDYVNAWRHVHDIFREEDCNNVQWVWSPNWNAEWDLAKFKEIYPGDEYVDWVGMSIFNWGTTVYDKQWYTIDQRLGWRYKLAEEFKKPIVIAEISSDETGGNKAEWILDCFQQIRTDYPKVKAVVWFNYPNARYNEKILWSIDSSPKALAAFKEAISDPYFLGPQIKTKEVKISQN